METTSGSRRQNAVELCPEQQGRNLVQTAAAQAPAAEAATAEGQWIMTKRQAFMRFMRRYHWYLLAIFAVIAFLQDVTR
jgi:hypothetical protein